MIDTPGSRRSALHIALALGLYGLLPKARACEFFASSLRITHPWTRATPADAPYATVCMRFDEVSRDDRLIGVETPVATGAELAGAGTGPTLDLFIASGQETLLSEAGPHIRLTGLQYALEVGREYPMRLHFEKGGVVNTRLSVDYTRFS
jgi:copper(I)-binding protein